MYRQLILVCALAGLLGVVWSGNINIEITCSISTGCMQCLSRGSEDIERCQQLYFYITYSTGNYRTGTNAVEISRYCNGDCPIILTTANHYCRTTTTTSDLLTMCPSYSVNPTGSFNVNRTVAASSCFPTITACLQCIGDDTPEATRCLQLYLLASNPNTSSTYASRYCERNCPLILNSFTGYCGIVISDSFSYCEQSSGQYCGNLRYMSESKFDKAVLSCSNCGSDACSFAINEYGCCLRQELGATCSNVPNNCNLPIDASTTDIRVNSTCLVTQCSPCLSRDSNHLERCEQQYSYLVAADGLQAAQATSVMQNFCSGECPSLLTLSDYYCGVNQRSTLWQICPTYDRIPSTDVDIRATFGNNQRCAVTETCEECIGSNSPEPTRCLQLFLLTLHPNMTNFYLEEYCKGNCPLTLATSEWYCGGSEAVVQTLIQACQKNKLDQYCMALNNDADFMTALVACQSNCSSISCLDGLRRYECCLEGRLPAQSCINSGRTCEVLTAGAPPPNLVPPLLIAIFSSVVYYLVCV